MLGAGCRNLAGYAPSDTPDARVPGADSRPDGALDATVDPEDAAPSREATSDPDTASDTGPDTGGLADLGAPDVCAGCLPGATRCASAATFELCEDYGNGCMRWGTPTNCPADQQCVLKSCECKAGCSWGSTRCKNATTEETCVKSASGCHSWDNPMSCPPNHACVGFSCVKVACFPGDTLSCKIGVCPGMATCKATGAGYSACVVDFSVASSEVCDGKDNDCDAKPDDGITPAPCAKTKGVCSGATTSCTGGSFPGCTNATYAAHSSAYRSVETSCDGKDNDCDGVVDEGLCVEPHHICEKGATTPACHRCCGPTCPTAPACPNAAECSADGLCSCNGKFCKATERCLKNLAQQPVCACNQWICGIDPITKIYCGSCKSNEQCIGGKCVGSGT
jgi:hypothetical protein